MPFPSLKTPELCDQILSRIANAEPLSKILRDEGMPHQTTWGDWLRDDEALALAHARAREVSGEIIAETALAIADDLIDDPASRRVRVETRLKLLACWHPKRYGAKQEVEHKGTVSFNAAPADTGIL